MSEVYIEVSTVSAAAECARLLVASDTSARIVVRDGQASSSVWTASQKPVTPAAAAQPQQQRARNGEGLDSTRPRTRRGGKAWRRAHHRGPLGSTTSSRSGCSEESQHSSASRASTGQECQQQAPAQQQHQQQQQQQQQLQQVLQPFLEEKWSVRGTQRHSTCNGECRGPLLTGGKARSSAGKAPREGGSSQARSDGQNGGQARSGDGGQTCTGSTGVGASSQRTSAGRTDAPLEEAGASSPARSDRTEGEDSVGASSQPRSGGRTNTSLEEVGASSQACSFGRAGTPRKAVGASSHAHSSGRTDPLLRQGAGDTHAQDKASAEDAGVRESQAELSEAESQGEADAAGIASPSLANSVARCSQQFDAVGHDALPWTLGCKNTFLTIQDARSGVDLPSLCRAQSMPQLHVPEFFLLDSDGALGEAEAEEWSSSSDSQEALLAPSPLKSSRVLGAHPSDSTTDGDVFARRPCGADNAERARIEAWLDERYDFQCKADRIAVVDGMIDAGRASLS